MSTRWRRAVSNAHAATLGLAIWASLTRLGSGSWAVTRATQTGASVRSVWTASTAESGIRFGRRGFSRLLDGSRVVGWLSLLGGLFMNPLERARRGARVTVLMGWLGTTTRSSFLYRWLTTEPEPEVIVIDLRETSTAGPFIAWLDRTVASLLPGVRSATVTAAVRTTWHRARARPIRYASVVVLVVVAVSGARLALRGTPSRWVVIGHVFVAIFTLLGLRSTISAQELADTRIGRAVIAAFEPPEPPEGRKP